MIKKYYPTSAKEVWGWPEFKALCQRLGIPELPDRELTIHLDFEGIVYITHEYLGQDRKEAEV